MTPFTLPTRHRPATSLFACLTLALSACSPSGPPSRTRDSGLDASVRDVPGADVTFPDTGPPAPPPCTPGDLICDGNTFAECGADGSSRLNPEVCTQVCNPGVGCGICEIGGRTCDGTVSRICNESGDTTYYGRDCAELGSACNADGYCDDECGAAEGANSYLGCEYWVPVLPNGAANLDGVTLEGPATWRARFDVRIVVANTGESAATVTLTQNDAVLSTHTIEPGAAQDIAIPWNPAAATASSYTDTPVRVVSNRPITMAMFNPFEYSAGGGFSFSNDASLLFPAHTYQRSFIATTYTPTAGLPGFVSIVATQDTMINVRPTAAVSAGGPVPGGITPGAVATFAMTRGQHVALQGGDLSGTRVEATAPVAVFSGTQCSNIPAGFTACDHIESQMPPIETWSIQYVGAAMGEVGAQRRNPVRIFAAVNGTTVTINPPPPSGGIITLNDGEFHEVILEDGFVIAGDNPILVAQYIPGQDFAGGARGDPAMMVLPPTAQYRTDYPFVAPTSYNAGTNGQNFVLLIRSPGQNVNLDGAMLSASWTPVGEFEWAIVPINGGAHRLSADEPFGAISYGLGTYTSYAYPTGLDLEVEYVPPPVLL